MLRSVIGWSGVIILLLAIWVWMQLPDKNMRLIFCDVGQGDSTLVELGYFQALIDTGEKMEAVMDCLNEHMPFWDRKIEIVFVSHPDKDHSGALGEIMKSFEIGRVIKTGMVGDIVRVGDLWFEILSNSQIEDGEGAVVCGSTNECSMVIRVRYKKFSGLFTGDLGESEELSLIDRGVIKHEDVLKVPHHGSKFSSSRIFLEALRPKLAVISVGAKNNYGHPNSDTLMRLDMVGAKVVRTDLLGTIEVVSDGEKVWLVKN